MNVGIEPETMVSAALANRARPTTLYFYFLTNYLKLYNHYPHFYNEVGNSETGIEFNEERIFTNYLSSYFISVIPTTQGEYRMVQVTDLTVSTCV